VPDKKSAKTAAKPAAKTAPAAKKAAPAPRREPAAKKAAPAKPVKAAKAAPPKVEPKKAAAKPAAPAPKAAPPAKVAAKKAETKPAPAPKVAAKPEPKAKAAAKPEAKPAKTAAKAAPEPKGKAKVAPPAKAAKPAPAPKPEKVKAEKPPKPPKAPKPPKPPKPPKLAPVAAAFAGPIPSKPLAVAAGRAQPVLRSPIATPARAAPKPLAVPKPVAAVEPEHVGDSQAVPSFKAKAPDKKGMVLVGAIAGAFGVKGEVRLRAFTDKNEGVISYGPLYGEDGKILLKPKSWRELKDGVAIVTAEVKSREDAEKMKGQKLFVPRANLPATGADEFYVVDLLGSRAEALDGTVLGDIVAVWNFGAGDILEYKPPNGGPNVRITFTREAVPHVDLPAKRVVLDPPPPEPPQSK
jgi:16S rRNA processing protein RimM